MTGSLEILAKLPGKGSPLFLHAAAKKLSSRHFPEPRKKLLLRYFPGFRKRLGKHRQLSPRDFLKKKGLFGKGFHFSEFLSPIPGREAGIMAQYVLDKGFSESPGSSKRFGVLFFQRFRHLPEGKEVPRRGRGVGVPRKNVAIAVISGMNVFGRFEDCFVFIQKNTVAVTPRELQEKVFFLYEPCPEKLFEGASQDSVLIKLLHPGNAGSRKVGLYGMSYGKRNGPLFQKGPDISFRGQGAAVVKRIPAEEESPLGETSLAKPQGKPGVPPEKISRSSGLLRKSFGEGKSKERNDLRAYGHDEQAPFDVVW
jgi:hypothetical protein